ncbi:MAG: LTA synthase family protein [Ruminiclostridium sp.]|nr:LTA synthase family protein [Ruminiclostridium sp.]
MKRQSIFTLLGLLLAPLVVLWATQAIWLDDLAAPLPWMIAHPQAVGLFWVLFSSVSFTLYGFFRRLFWACLPQSLVCLVFAYASRCKLNINGAPIQLSDFSLMGNLGDVAGYAADQLIPTATAVIAALAVVVMLVIFLCLGTWRLPAPLGMVLGSLSMVLLISAFSPGGLQTAAVKLDEGCYDQMERNDQAGVCLGLYTAWCQRIHTENTLASLDSVGLADYFRADAAQERPPVSLETSPDIIFITSEAFFDVTHLPGLTFETDPLPVFHALSQTCTNGRFLSNNYGGGTGWVEMEMFTTLTSSHLMEGDTLSTLDPAVYETLPTTVRLLEKAGYSTLSLHAHTAELYDRETIYPAIGFDEVCFIDDFWVEPERSGNYASDESFAREIIARYEARDPGAPCFIYGLSMENHQSYYPEKYGEPSGFPAQCDLLSQEDLTYLDSLVMGLNHADASLGMLTDYFSQCPRPVMLVFVGDHLPSMNLADGEDIYTCLGISPDTDSSQWEAETLAEILSTDYLIWTNYEEEALPDRTESCTFLGLHVLQRTGLPLNQYFTWLEENIASRMLLNRGRFFADETGTPSYEVPADAQPLLDSYTALERSLAYPQ